MNVLALDTSGSAFYAALKKGEQYFDNSLTSNSMMHSERIIPVITELLDKAGISLKDIDLLVCTRGPGSFTGLRIAMSALKGISMGSGIPLVSVSTLEAWARAAGSVSGVKVAVIDAKKQRFYLSAFNEERLMPDTDGTIADLSFLEEGYTVVGPDAKAFAEAYPQVKMEVKDVSSDFTRALIEFGIESFEKNGADHIGQGPVYLRKSDAEIALEERLRNE